jgi:hypothetical protein
VNLGIAFDYPIGQGGFEGPRCLNQRRRAIILRLGGCGSSRADPSRSTDSGDLVASLRNFLGLAMFSQNDSREDTSKVVRVAWRRGMETNLKAKAEKYETKAAQCEEWAREATEGPPCHRRHRYGRGVFGR